MTGPEVESPKFKWWDKLRMAMPMVSGTSSTHTPEVNQAVNHILRGWDVKNMMWTQPVWPSLELTRDGGTMKVIFRSDWRQEGSIEEHRTVANAEVTNHRDESVGGPSGGEMNKDAATNNEVTNKGANNGETNSGETN